MTSPVHPHSPTAPLELQPYLHAMIERRQHKVLPDDIEQKMLDSGYVTRKLGGLQVMGKGQMALMRKK